MAANQPIDESQQPLLTDGDAEQQVKAAPKVSWQSELRSILLLALPCIVTTCSSQTMVVTDQIFVGHLGVTELAAAALGNTYFNLMWFFLLGCATALDTLGSQAFGANDYSALLTWSFAAGTVLSVLCGLVAAGLWFAREVAIHVFFQPLDVADQVSVFCRYLIPGLWPMVWSVVLMKFMQTQNCMVPPALVAAGTCLLNIGNNWLLIRYMGFIGAPIATSISRGVQFVVYVIVILRLQGKNHPRRWARWGSKLRRCFAKACSWKVLGVFIVLGIPGGAMLALEAGSFEITTAFAGALGTVEVSAHSTLLGICSYTFISFPFAIATAATIRVGNLLGANKPEQAALAGRICVICGTAFQSSCGVLMWLLRDKIGYLFTNDPDVVDTVSKIVVFGVGFQFFDGAYGTSQGVLRGMGRQTQLMVYNLIGFWCLGVALGWYLTFKADSGLGLKGLWIGIDVGDFSAMSLCLVTWLVVNWKKEAKLAVENADLVAGHENELEAVGHVEGDMADACDFLIQADNDPFSQVPGSAGPVNPFGSPRFLSPRAGYRGA